MSDAQAHYESALSFLKWALGIAATAITVIIATGAFFFYQNMSDARKDAQQEAKRIAEVEVRDAVATPRVVQAVNDAVNDAIKTRFQSQIDAELQKTVERIKIMSRIASLGQSLKTNVIGHPFDELYDIRASSNDELIRNFVTEVIDDAAQEFEARFSVFVGKSDQKWFMDQAKRNVDLKNNPNPTLAQIQEATYRFIARPKIIAVIRSQNVLILEHISDLKVRNSLDIDGVKEWAKAQGFSAEEKKVESPK